MMHLKLLFGIVIFFCLTSADNNPGHAVEAKKQPQPKKDKLFIVPLSENNLYTKAKGDILKYKILCVQERDTCRLEIDTIKRQK